MLLGKSRGHIKLDTQWPNEYDLPGEFHLSNCNHVKLVA